MPINPRLAEEALPLLERLFAREEPIRPGRPIPDDFPEFHEPSLPREAPGLPLGRPKPKIPPGWFQTVRENPEQIADLHHARQAFNLKHGPGAFEGTLGIRSDDPWGSHGGDIIPWIAAALGLGGGALWYAGTHPTEIEDFMVHQQSPPP